MQSRATSPMMSAATGTSRQREDGQALLGGDPLDGLARRLPLGLVEGQEGQADGVPAGRGQGDRAHLAQEGVGHLGEDAGAVAHEGVGAGGAAVVEVAQRGERVLHDVVAGLAAHRRHHGDAARVVLVLGAVQPDVGGLGGEARGA